MATITAGTARTTAGGKVPIRIVGLLRTPDVQIDLYLRDEKSNRYVLYRRKDQPCLAHDLVSLQSNGIDLLYTDEKSRFLYAARLQEELPHQLENERLSDVERFSLLHECGTLELDRALRSTDVGVSVTVAREVGQRIAKLLSRADYVPSQVYGILQHDYYTFTHLINVSTYCVLLAKHLGISDEPTLERIAVGGLLHDIGKRALPLTVLNKRGPLTESERELIQTHPRLGYKLLCNREEVTTDQLMMVYQHHEALDGSGYPVHLVGEEIQFETRICTVADVFDALTSLRPYRQPKPVAEVSEWLLHHADTRFDREMVECWTSSMSFPVSQAN